MSHERLSVTPSRPWRVLPAVATALVAAACSYSYQVYGRLGAEDGATGIECSVAVQQVDIDPPYGLDTCGAADGEGRAPERTLVRLGERFRCRVSGNKDELFEVLVRCPGYAPLDVPLPVEACRAWFSNCDDIEMGTLTVRR